MNETKTTRKDFFAALKVCKTVMVHAQISREDGAYVRVSKASIREGANAIPIDCSEEFKFWVEDSTLFVN